ncbi:hypothetical protein FE374_01355 [Georgenia yuyongxinii]|uniref:Peptidase M48 domain-containing protein n=1 Tax=Georgenia yuyongxinii TaxID=2589797 RepID=A0A5B8C648_9MICO|nr:M48 family metalloprotease [Georgenia yuyongxinii]QDC23456.1 hypothetical protein FE374_01355 [Georgenia yuyongxinii]
MGTVAGVRGRPDTLVYPSPTTARFVLLVLAILAGGLYVGSWTHTLLEGEAWQQQVTSCSTVPAADPLQQQATFERCTAAVERRRAAYSAGGAAATLVGGGVVLLAVPVVLERRRRLRPLPPRLARAGLRAAQLAAEQGLRRPPRLMIGGATQRDAFSYGVPGAYRVALPPKAALRPGDSALFDPLLRHELAHVRHHDVALAWLARSVWYAFIPILLVPVAISLAREDLGVTLDYSWRAALVLTVVRLVANAVLRAREHDADLAAARGDDGRRRDLGALLSSLGPGSRPSLWGRLRAQHPTVGQRLVVLEDPTAASRPTAVDGLTAAFLAAAVAPVLRSTATPALTGSGNVDLSTLFASTVAGAILGVAVGLGLWRAALFARFSGRPPRPVPVALAVAAGLVLGGALSLGQVGTVSGIGPDNPLTVLVQGLAGLGATAVVAGLGEVWADAAPNVPSARVHWVGALLTSAVVFSVAVWTASRLVDTLDAGGGAFALVALTNLDPPWLVTVTALALPAATALVLRGHGTGSRAPAWAVELGDRPAWLVGPGPGLAGTLMVGLSAGLAGAAAIVAFRLLAGPGGTGGEQLARYFGYVLVGATAAAAAMVAMGLAGGVRAVGAALVALPVAGLTPLAGFLVMNTALGGDLTRTFGQPLLVRPLGAGLMLALLVAGVGLLPVRRVAVPARSLLAATLAVALSATALGGRIVLTSNPVDLAAELAAVQDDLDAQAYAGQVALPLMRQFEAVGAAQERLRSTGPVSPAAQAARLREEVLEPLTAMQAQARSYDPPDERVAAVHGLVVQALARLTEGTRLAADAVEHQDAATLATANELLSEGTALRARWLAAVTDLTGS